MLNFGGQFLIVLLKFKAFSISNFLMRCFSVSTAYLRKTLRAKDEGLQLKLWVLSQVT